MTIERYWPLLFLAIIPGLWWIRRHSETDLSPKHLTLSTALRSLIIVLLVIALMQPTLYHSTSAVSVVYLLDVSESVSPGGIQQAIEWLQKTNQDGKPDHAQFVAFGSN